MVPLTSLSIRKLTHFPLFCCCCYSFLIGRILPPNGSLYFGQHRLVLNEGFTPSTCFRGSMACMNLWDYALSSLTIKSMARSCRRKGNLVNSDGVEAKSLNSQVFVLKQRTVFVFLFSLQLFCLQLHGILIMNAQGNILFRAHLLVHYGARDILRRILSFVFS